MRQETTAKRKIRGPWGLAATLGLALILGGCLVEVRHVENAGPELARARAEIQELVSRPGRATSVEVLVYDPSDQKLVRVGVPLWLARKVADHGDLDLGDEMDEKVQDRLRGIRLRDLERVGRGALVEVQDRDGTHVLVWLR